MLALRAIWLGFLSLLLWAIVTALTGTWWVGLLAAWALLAYGIVTGVSRYAQQREAQWQEVQRTYREYLAAKASADAARRGGGSGSGSGSGTSTNPADAGTPRAIQVKSAAPTPTNAAPHAI